MVLQFSSSSTCSSVLNRFAIGDTRIQIHDSKFLFANSNIMICGNSCGTLKSGLHRLNKCLSIAVPKENGFPKVTASNQMASESCIASIRILRELDGAEARRCMECD